MIVATRKNRERFAIKKSYSIESESPESSESETQETVEVVAWDDDLIDQNGYPSRRRSLVLDARFETKVNKDNKRDWLEEIRQFSRDSELSEDDLILVDHASIPEVIPEQHEKVEAAAAAAAPTAETKEEVKPEEATIVLTLKDNMLSLGNILTSIDSFKGAIIHMESRQSREGGCQFDILLKIEIVWTNLVALLRSLRQIPSIFAVNVISTEGHIVKEPWYPRHISELDLCNHLMTKFEPDLDMTHPGFADKEYRARRKMIADIAFDYKFGEPIPRVDYQEIEIKTWGHVFNQLVDLQKHACKQYVDAFTLLQREVNYAADNIPQLEDVSNFLRRRTGFTLRPAAGLLTARDFLASLAYRVFQCTQYVRHGSSPDHSPEPDCVHELLGHVPMLADPGFAQFSQELGLASLGASDEEIEQFSTLYWFTVEFGLCKENGVTKAYGAGLLSSYGELNHALSDKPQHKTFEPEVTAIEPYQDQDYQDVYFVAESFRDVQVKFSRWVEEHMKRPYEVRYDPFTQTIEVLDSADKLEAAVNQMKLEVNYLANAVSHMKFR